MCLNDTADTSFFLVLSNYRERVILRDIEDFDEKGVSAVTNRKSAFFCVIVV